MILVVCPVCQKGTDRKTAESTWVFAHRKGDETETLVCSDKCKKVYETVN